MIIPIWFIIWMILAFVCLGWGMFDFLKHWEPYAKSEAKSQVVTKEIFNDAPKLDTKLYFTPQTIPDNEIESSTIITIRGFKGVENEISVSAS